MDDECIWGLNSASVVNAEEAQHQLPESNDPELADHSIHKVEGSKNAYPYKRDSLQYNV